MTSLALNTISRSSTRSPLFTSTVKSPQAGPHFRKRCRSFTRSKNVRRVTVYRASPDAFASSDHDACYVAFHDNGDNHALEEKRGRIFCTWGRLQIESDVAMIDVEAESAGVLGKILMPDGSKNIPVEQVIALVEKPDIMNFSSQVPTPPPYNPIPSPPSCSLASPVRPDSFNPPFLATAHRSPTLAGVHHGHHHHRGMAMRHTRGATLTIVPPSPRITVSLPIKSVSSAKLHTGNSAAQPEIDIKQSEEALASPILVDGAAIRRMFRSNFSRSSLSATPYNSALSASARNAEDYFDGLL